MVKQEKEQKKKDRKTLTFFIIMFPGVIAIIVASMAGIDFLSSLLQIVLLFFQAVLLKQFLDDYYDTYGY